MSVRISADAATNMTDGLHSMFDEDSQVMRAKWRIGFAIPNPINILNQTGSRFPFAIIAANPQATTYTVTFTVVDSTSAPVENIKVKFGGMSSKTSSDGVAIFVSQPNQNYMYTVYNSNGTIYKRDEVQVTTSDVNISVTLN